MEEKTNIEKGTSEIYQVIGEFAVTFEKICFNMLLCVREILRKDGLSNEAVIDVIIAGMTAEPIRTLLQSLLAESFNPTTYEKKIISNLMTRFQELISERNSILHGSTLVGYGSSPEDDYSEAPSFKFDKNKNGSSIKVKTISKTTMQPRIQEAKELEKLFHSLMASICLRRLEGSGDFGGFFVLDKNGDVHPKEGS